jgi:hypothetical protein
MTSEVNVRNGILAPEPRLSAFGHFRPCETDARNACRSGNFEEIGRRRFLSLGTILGTCQEQVRHIRHLLAETAEAASAMAD